ncbi:MAG: type II toxin-antitoxin system RelE/ParE family toxin [Spirochaetota bacterium]
MYKIVITNEVIEEVEEIVAWYEEQKQGLGIDFYMKFEDALNFVSKNPKIFAKVLFKFRRVLTNRFPYAIFYYEDQANKTVDVVGIFNTSRNSEIIRKKLSFKAK